MHRADSNLDFSQISHGRRACTDFRSPSLPPRSYLPQSWNPSIQRTTILVQDIFYERFIDILFEVYTAAFLIMWFLTAIRSPSRSLPPACSKPRWSLLFARAVDPIKWSRVVSSQWACTWGFYSNNIYHSCRQLLDSNFQRLAAPHVHPSIFSVACSSGLGKGVLSFSSFRLRDKVCHNPHACAKTSHMKKRKKERKKGLGGSDIKFLVIMSQWECTEGEMLRKNLAMSSAPSCCLRTGHYGPPQHLEKSWPVAANAPVIGFCNFKSCALACDHRLQTQATANTKRFCHSESEARLHTCTMSR